MLWSEESNLILATAALAIAILAIACRTESVQTDVSEAPYAEVQGAVLGWASDRLHEVDCDLRGVSDGSKLLCAELGFWVSEEAGDFGMMCYYGELAAGFLVSSNEERMCQIQMLERLAALAINGQCAVGRGDRMNKLGRAVIHMANLYSESGNCVMARALNEWIVFGPYSGDLDKNRRFDARINIMELVLGKECPNLNGEPVCQPDTRDLRVAIHHFAAAGSGDLPSVYSPICEVTLLWGRGFIAEAQGDDQEAKSQYEEALKRSDRLVSISKTESDGLKSKLEGALDRVSKGR